MTRYGECCRSRYPAAEDQSEFAEMCGDVADSDGDAVAEHADSCPGTESGRPVDDRGCVLDSDNDGVADDRDQCPGTREGAEVRDNGREVIEIDPEGGAQNRRGIILPR